MKKQQLMLKKHEIDKKKQKNMGVCIEKIYFSRKF